MLGGAIGAGARFAVARWSLAVLGPTAWPWSTFAVNVVGGLLMGLLAGVVVRDGPVDDNLFLFLGTGVLGGFTTFSAFSLDVAAMIQRGAIAAAALYAAARAGRVEHAVGGQARTGREAAGLEGSALTGAAGHPCQPRAGGPRQPGSRREGARDGRQTLADEDDRRRRMQEHAEDEEGEEGEGEESEETEGEESEGGEDSGDEE